MDFSKVKLEAKPLPKRQGGGGRRIDFSPLLEAASKMDPNGTEFLSFDGGTALHNYRTQILSGTIEGAAVGDWMVRVIKVSDKTDTEPEVNRLFIKPANDEERAALIARKAEAPAEKPAKSAKGSKSPLD